MDNIAFDELCDVSTMLDLALVLNISLETLEKYCQDNNTSYIDFKIPKRSGGVRTISAPCPELMDIQRRFYRILLRYYSPPESAHGYIKGRSIITNATPHCDKHYVFNIDLSNFFPSITFQRISGLLQGYPICCQREVADALANLCCHSRKLPQGAPTSPLISNMICRSMDHDLTVLARKHSCSFTRFADDITFSRQQPPFPAEIASKAPEGQWTTGVSLLKIISVSGFVVNESKVRMHCKYTRQEVTGLVTNAFPNVKRSYVRETRAMLHAWETFGLESASQAYGHKAARSRSQPNKPSAGFDNILCGRVMFITMVKGATDQIAERLRDRLCKLDPSYSRYFKYLPVSPKLGLAGASEQLPEIAPSSMNEELRKQLRTISRNMDDLALKMSLLSRKRPTEAAREDFMTLFNAILHRLLTELDLGDCAGIVKGNSDPRWSQLHPATREQLATAHSLASTCVASFLHLAILELCIAIEAEVSTNIFDRLRGARFSEDQLLANGDHCTGHDWLAKFARNKGTLTLSQFSRIIAYARANATYGLYRLLLKEMEVQYPFTWQRIAELITDLTLAKPGKICGMQQSIASIRNACAHPGPHRDKLATHENYSAIWQYALEKPLELLFLLVQPVELGPLDGISHEKSEAN